MPRRACRAARTSPRSPAPECRTAPRSRQRSSTAPAGTKRSQAVQQVSLLGLEDAADDARELVGDALGHRVPVTPEDPPHPDELAQAHQGVGGYLRVDLADLA